MTGIQHICGNSVTGMKQISGIDVTVSNTDLWLCCNRSVCDRPVTALFLCMGKDSIGFPPFLWKRVPGFLLLKPPFQNLPNCQSIMLNMPTCNITYIYVLTNFSNLFHCNCKNSTINALPFSSNLTMQLAVDCKLQK